MNYDLWFEKCKSGDESSWERLLGRFSRLVYSVPRRMGLSSDACDDVLQDTFLALYQHFGSIHDGAALPNWLLTTARRLARRQGQKSGRELPLETATRVQAQENEEVAVCALYANSRRAQIKVAMAGLPETNRNLLTMLYYEDRSYAETASTLGRPISSIGPVRQRSLEKLKAQLLRTSA